MLTLFSGSLGAGKKRVKVQVHPQVLKSGPSSGPVPRAKAESSKSKVVVGQAGKTQAGKSQVGNSKSGQEKKVLRPVPGIGARQPVGQEERRASSAPATTSTFPENVRSTRTRNGTVIQHYQPQLQPSKSTDDRFLMSGGLGVEESIRSPDSGGGVGIDARGGMVCMGEGLTSEGYPNSAYSYDSESLYAAGGSARAAGAGTASATSLTTAGVTGEEDEGGEGTGDEGKGKKGEHGMERERTVRASASHAVLSVRRKMGRCSP